MKVKVSVEVDIDFDLKSDGMEHDESVVDSNQARQAVVEALHSVDVVDNLADMISDHTGWCVNSVSMTTPN